MEKGLMTNYMSLFESLTIEVKLDLLARLSESIRLDLSSPSTDKVALLESYQVLGLIWMRI